ncbi:calpain-9-like isoform X1 [Pelobates cultripes]|uniref:Calpain-9-like isoform X1 n=1 Tax=Pelobates cultripes TaxID=61616 RepID=A0AAD1T074_PELCU|nr:calpain-9-like isoform X1 [Pelobates cultripes]
MEPFPAKRRRCDSSEAPTERPLFVDPSFPHDEALRIDGVTWRRPKEICARPQFIVDGATRRDVCQGNLSNCWFLSALSCLSLYPHLLQQVVPAGQDFEDGYNGSFKFQFWQYGKWTEVLVDDLLPTVPLGDNGDCGVGRAQYKLLFMHSNDTDEFWSSLLEKAYAKLKGGYSALQMGFASEALVDMTGGIVQSIKTSGSSTELWSHLSHMLQRGALICCGNTQNTEPYTTIHHNILGIYYPFYITVTAPTGRLFLEGYSRYLLPFLYHWYCSHWKAIPGIYYPFYITVTAPTGRLFQVSTTLSISLLLLPLEGYSSSFLGGTDSVSHSSFSPSVCATLQWEGQTHDSRFAACIPDVGYTEKRYSFWMNPQFSFVLLEEDNNSNHPHPACNFIVAVMQKHQRLRRAGSIRVACNIFQGDETHAYLFEETLRHSQPLLCSGPCDNHREVVVCSRLPPGRYVIIPSLEKASDEGEFVIRVLKEKNCSRPPGGAIPYREILPLPLEEDLCSDRFQLFASQDGRLTNTQLQKLLASLFNEFAPTLPSFTLDMCRCLLASVDTAAVGSIDYEQFTELWKAISTGTRIFYNMPRQEDGKLGKDQIVPALQAAGKKFVKFIH